MTVDEFCTRCDEILVERERTLKTHHISDLHLYKKIVQRRGLVTSTDEYWLTIVGVPYSGYVVKQVPRIGKKINAVPQKLF